MGSLADRAGRAGFIDEISVMRSSGGLVSLGRASAFPASILLSGPAGGVVAAAALGELMGCDTLISFDMGGTSTDVCRVQPGPARGDVQPRDRGLRLPDALGGGAHRRSRAAARWRGPTAAGRSGWGPAPQEPIPARPAMAAAALEPTVTDANLVLGRLDPSAKLAGSVALRPDQAAAAFKRLGSELPLEEVEAALGVVAVVESHMSHAVRAVSVEQGTDPRDMRR